MLKFLISAAMCLFFSTSALAVEPADQVQDQRSSEEQTADEMIKFLMRKAPAKKISKNDLYRAGMTRDIVGVASDHKIPFDLFILLQYRESSFRENVDGKKGERGIGQVMDPKHWGCDMSTRVGQLECSAKVLIHGFRKCGTWNGALSAYQSKGAKCRPRKGSYHATQVKSRINQLARLRTRFQS